MIGRFMLELEEADWTKYMCSRTPQGRRLIFTKYI